MKTSNLEVASAFSSQEHSQNLHDITEALKSQMDHILINGKWKSSSPDVKDYRGADVVSVHTLVIRVFSEKIAQDQNANRKLTSVLAKVQRRISQRWRVSETPEEKRHLQGEPETH